LGFLREVTVDHREKKYSSDLNPGVSEEEKPVKMLTTILRFQGRSKRFLTILGTQ
jgi:hypothetical protein